MEYGNLLMGECLRMFIRQQLRRWRRYGLDAEPNCIHSDVQTDRKDQSKSPEALQGRRCTLITAQFVGKWQWCSPFSWWWWWWRCSEWWINSLPMLSTYLWSSVLAPSSAEAFIQWRALKIAKSCSTKLSSNGIVIFLSSKFFVVSLCDDKW